MARLKFLNNWHMIVDLAATKFSNHCASWKKDVQTINKLSDSCLYKRVFVTNLHRHTHAYRHTDRWLSSNTCMELNQIQIFFHIQDKNTQLVTVMEQIHLLAVQLSVCSQIGASTTTLSCVCVCVHVCLCVCTSECDSSAESLISYSSGRMLSSTPAWRWCMTAEHSVYNLSVHTHTHTHTSRHPGTTVSPYCRRKHIHCVYYVHQTDLKTL